MIALRRASERLYRHRRNQEVWLTFFHQNQPSPLADGFTALELLNEDRLPPGANVAHLPQHEAEIITYVREGAVAYEDSLGGSGVLQAGEFQHVSTSGKARYTQTNASPTEWAHVFQVWLRPASAGLKTGYEQKRFSTADRRGGLRIVASPNTQRGSLRTYQDARLYSALLDPGQHVVHELELGRSAWLQLVQGQATLGDLVLSTGDSVGITAEYALSLTARQETEILLVDLRPSQFPPFHPGALR